MESPEPALPPKNLREEEEVPEEQQVPSEVEVRTPEKAGQKGVKLDRYEGFRSGLLAACKSTMPILEAGAVVWRNLEKLHTPLGRFREEFGKHAVAQEGSAIPQMYFQFLWRP